MSIVKKSIGIALAALMLLSAFVTAPLSANALYYPSWPTDEDIEAATAEKNFAKPENLRVVATTDSSVTVSWQYADWGYSLAYTTSAEAEPEWSTEYTNRTDGSKADWKVTVDNLTAGKTYYIYVKHATIDVVSMHAVYLSGETSMVKVKLKKDNPVTVKTAVKSVTASALKKSKKTVKPLTVGKAKGEVKVVKVKSGTNSKLYSKITVAQKTGAITLKKGAYKKGSYKVKLKVTAAGNSGYNSKTITKTVTVKIK